MTHEEMLEEAQKREEENKQSNRKKPFVKRRLIPDDYRTPDD